MVNWRFGILGVPLRIPIPFIFGDPRNPNRQTPQTINLTIIWIAQSKSQQK